MRVLASVSPVKDLDSHALPADLYQPPRWDAARFSIGLLPAFSFIVGWLFWIYVNPPTGPSVPNMAVTFGLMAVMTPMNMLRLIPFIVVAVLAFLAPLYFLVMPRLSTGPELLALVFAFAFIARVVLVGRFTILRTITLAAFVMMSCIATFISSAELEKRGSTTIRITGPLGTFPNAVDNRLLLWRFGGF